MAAHNPVARLLVPMNVQRSSAGSSMLSKSRNIRWLRRFAAVEARSSHRAMVWRAWPVTRAVAELLTPSTRRLATWSHSLRAQRRPLYAVPVCVLTGSPADRAAVPPASAPLRRKRAVAHDGEAQCSTVGTPALGAGHPVDRVHRSRVPGGNPRFSPKISEVKATDQQRPAQAPPDERAVAKGREMARFAIFVDGSNVFGALKSMNLEVDDYEALYGYVFRETHAVWVGTTGETDRIPSRLQRVYWYAVGSIDDWDLALPQSQTALRNAFGRDREIRELWLAITGKANPGLAGQALDDKAWANCFADFRQWYDGKRQILAGMRSFHQGIRIRTNLIDVYEHGHWKVNFLHKWVEEKGLDTSLAVDMVALQDNYDVAVVMSGDADNIPSIRHMKGRGKHIAAVEFVNGSPPESKGRSFSSRLKEHADFVIQIYETELLRLKIGNRPKPKARQAG